jgi:hypothetical protein
VITGIPWWVAVLATLGIIGFWVALLIVGDKIDRWFQDRQTVKLQDPKGRA